MIPLLQTLLLNGTLGLGAYWMARHGFRQPAGLTRSLAAVVLAWAWSTLGMEILGSFGWLAWGPLCGWSSLGMLLGLVVRGRDRQTPPSLIQCPEERGWGWSSIAALALVLWGSSVLLGPSVLLPVKVVSDGPIYHLYFAARWWKEGRLFLIAAPFGENGAPYFPAGGDLWFAWLMTSWGGDRLAKVGQAPFLLVAGMAAFASARRLGARRASAMLATAWFVSSTPLLLYSFEPNVDTIFVAGYLLAALFLLHYCLDDPRASTLALAALAAGGALGTKPTGIVFVPPLLGLLALAAVVRPKSVRDKIVHLLVVALGPLVISGFWYGRNFVLTGNPLYPLHLEAFGRVWLAGWYGPGAMLHSPYFIRLANWRAFIDTALAVFDPRLAPVWAASLVGVWAWGRPGSGRDRWVWGFSALSLFNIALYWLLIPYRTQQRFMLQALGLAAVPLAILLDRSRWLRCAAFALLALHLLTYQNWPFHGPTPPWDLESQIPNGIPPAIGLGELISKTRDGSLRTDLSIRTSLTVALGFASLVASWAALRTTGLATALRAVVSGVALLALALLRVSAPVNDARLHFYPVFPDYYRGWLELDLRAGPNGARIAYAGNDLPYYLLGVGLRNDVRYVNVDGHRDWLMHDYRRQARSEGQPTWPDPRPGWDRIRPDYDAWLANLRAERIQILVVARANPAEGAHNVADAEGFPIERRWADAHPETFVPLYGVVEGDPLMRIYRVRPSGHRFDR